MQSLANRVSRRALLRSVGALHSDVSHSLVAKQSYFAASLQRHIQELKKPAIPADFLKWSALGFYRTAKFASGFSPLQPKPLESIIDVERAKNKTPEELAVIWDDVMCYNFACIF